MSGQNWLLELISERDETTKEEGLPPIFEPIPHSLFFFISLRLLRRLDNFTRSYNQRSEPQMKMLRQIYFEGSKRRETYAGHYAFSSKTAAAAGSQDLLKVTDINGR